MNEMAKHRKEQLKIGDELGYTYYKLIGPNDGRTCKTCYEALNIISTKDEWLRLYPKIYSLGLHNACRCQLVPVLVDKHKVNIIKIGEMEIKSYIEL